MANKPIGTRVDTPLLQKFDNACNYMGITRSEKIRNFMTEYIAEVEFIRWVRENKNKVNDVPPTPSMKLLRKILDAVENVK